MKLIGGQKVTAVLLLTREKKIPSETSSLLKDVSATFLLVCFVCRKESTCETRKNVCFTSKALFILEIIKF